jgi:hypothetical protein
MVLHFAPAKCMTFPMREALSHVGAGLAEVIAKPAAQRGERAVPKQKVQKR